MKHHLLSCEMLMSIMLIMYSCFTWIKYIHLQSAMWWHDQSSLLISGKYAWKMGWIDKSKEGSSTTPVIVEIRNDKEKQMYVYPETVRMQSDYWPYSYAEAVIECLLSATFKHTMHADSKKLLRKEWLMLLLGSVLKAAKLFGGRSNMVIWKDRATALTN